MRLHVLESLIILQLLMVFHRIDSSKMDNLDNYTIFSEGLSSKELALVFSRNISDPIMKTVTSDKTLCFHEKNVKFTHKYVVEEAIKIKKSRISLVSLPRLIASIWLTRASLGLPYRKGDIVETGVYKGGTSILLIHVLLNFDTCHRKFWGFDSFQGLPTSVSQDFKGRLQKGHKGQYSASEEVFLKNLKEHSAQDESIVRITKGYFNETLLEAPIRSIVFLRLDGDIFTSTWDALVHLYPKVVQGGFIYVDDYDSFNGCKAAVDLYRLQNNIKEPLTRILEGKRHYQRMKRQYEAVWWRKR